MPLSRVEPAAIVGASAISMPSGRTYGADIADISKRDAAGTVEVESSARNVVEFARPAALASFWQRVSAPATPWLVANDPFDTNAMRPAPGAPARAPPRRGPKKKKAGVRLK